MRRILDILHAFLAQAEGEKDHIEEEYGDLLFAMVNYGRQIGVEGEVAINGCNNKFERRFREVEKQVQDSGKDWQEFSLEELEAFWQEAKKK